jgi:hypothetical protein
MSGSVGGSASAGDAPHLLRRPVVGVAELIGGRKRSVTVRLR